MDTPKMQTDEFQNLWLVKLTSQQKIARLLRSLFVVKKVAEKQINAIKKYKKENKPKDISFMYFFETISSVWDNIDFAMALGKGSRRKFTFYPARAILENSFRLEYFIKRNKDDRNHIAIMELLRISKRGYDGEKLKNRNPNNYAENYKFFASFGKYPNIDDFDESKSDPFPSIKKLTEHSGLEGSKDWYGLYQSLCESTHGKMLGIMIATMDEMGEYVRCMMYISFMANQLLKITDVYIYGRVTQYVVNAIKKTELIAKARIQLKGS